MREIQIEIIKREGNMEYRQVAKTVQIEVCFIRIIFDSRQYFFKLLLTTEIKRPPYSSLERQSLPNITSSFQQSERPGFDSSGARYSFGQSVSKSWRVSFVVEKRVLMTTKEWRAAEGEKCTCSGHATGVEVLHAPRVFR